MRLHLTRPRVAKADRSSNASLQVNRGRYAAWEASNTDAATQLMSYSGSRSPDATRRENVGSIATFEQFWTRLGRLASRAACLHLGVTGLAAVSDGRAFLAKVWSASQRAASGHLARSYWLRSLDIRTMASVSSKAGSCPNDTGRLARVVRRTVTDDLPHDSKVFRIPSQERISWRLASRTRLEPAGEAWLRRAEHVARCTGSAPHLCRRNPIPRSHHEREERSLRTPFHPG